MKKLTKGELMLWALRMREIEPKKSNELHLRLDHELLNIIHAGRVLKWKPLIEV